MALNGLNDHFTLNFHYYELTLRVIIYLFTVESVYIRTWPAELCGSGVAEYLKSAEKLRIFRWRYGVGTLTNKANNSIYCYLVHYRLSTDSKTCDLEWSFCVKFCFALVCLELWSLAFEAWLLLTCSECCPANFKPKRTAAASRSFLAAFLINIFWRLPITMKSTTTTTTTTTRIIINDKKIPSNQNWIWIPIYSYTLRGLRSRRCLIARFCRYLCIMYNEVCFLMILSITWLQCRLFHQS